MRLRTLLLPVAAIALLSGCTMGAGAAAPVALDPDAKLSGEITVWSWDVAATALERLAADFEADHPGTTVNVVDVGYDNAYDKMSVGFQAGSGLPDVVTIETDRAPGYLNEFPTGLVDLTPVLGDAEADFDPFKWSAGSDASGAVKVAPWDSGTVGLFYRSDYFADAGIDPASIETWDDLVTAGEAIKESTGHTLLSLDVASGGAFQMLLQQQGLGLFDEAGDITITSPKAVEALALLQTLNEKGLLKNVKGWDGRVTSAKDGDSAVTPEAVWWIGTLLGDSPELSGRYGVAELPGFEWRSPAPKPLIFSEFGADAQAGYHDAVADPHKFSEEFQAEYYRQTLAMAAKVPSLAGLSPWLLKDFRSPRRQHPVFQQGWNRKGLISETGARKQAFYVLAEEYRRRAGSTR